MKKDKINYKIVNILFVVLIVAILYWISGLWIGIFNKILEILFPFLIGFAIAYALYPLKRYVCSTLSRTPLIPSIKRLAA